MTVRTVSRYEQDQAKIVDAVNQLAAGRSNATGSVTLSSTGGNSTTVSAPTCGAGSVVLLSAQTVNAAASVASAYVPSTDVTKGQFVVHYSSSTTTGRVLGWLVTG